MLHRRALHFVFKIGDRTKSINFYRNVLGMKVLRHEEFEEGCKAACNGPYDGRWSKTMIGYGAEDHHFVIELTYNYGIKSYLMGNDFKGITLRSSEVFNRVQTSGWDFQLELDTHIVQVKSPDGQLFFIHDAANDFAYWRELLDMYVVQRSRQSALLHFGTEQCQLELVQIDQPIERAAAFGRIAFSCPRNQLAGIQQRITEKKQTILRPLVSLDTPGKATVEVVILADPDGHEICFVGDEAFRQLSQIDANGDQLLNAAIEADKSSEWFAQHGRNKGVQH